MLEYNVTEKNQVPQSLLLALGSDGYDLTIDLQQVIPKAKESVKGVNL